MGNSEMDTASWHTGGPFLHANLTLHDFSINLWLLNMYYATCEQQMEGPPLAVSINLRRDQGEQRHAMQGQGRDMLRNGRDVLCKEEHTLALALQGV